MKQLGPAASKPIRPASMTSGEFLHLTIDRWFLVQIKEIVDFEEELAETS
jgi:hypothetical protein